MSSQPALPIQLGSRVRFLAAPELTGKVVEFRGPLGPKGVEIYRIRFLNRPYKSYVEVRGDQIEVLPPKS